MDNITISTFQLFQLFPDAESARKYLESRLWPNAVFPSVLVGIVIIPKASKISFSIWGNRLLLSIALTESIMMEIMSRQIADGLPEKNRQLIKIGGRGYIFLVDNNSFFP